MHIFNEITFYEVTLQFKKKTLVINLVMVYNNSSCVFQMKI